MTHEIIKTADYLLAVDDSKIIEGDWFLPISGIGWELNKPEQADVNMGCDNHHCKKIIAHRPLNNAPFLEGVDVLPPFDVEDDENLNISNVSGRYTLEEAKKFAMKKFNSDKMKSEYPKGGWVNIDDILSVLEVGVECGYKFGQKSKEKYKYTNEDMLVIRNQLVTMLPVGDVAAWDMIQAISKYKKWLDDYVESLSQPKMPVAFERETGRKLVLNSGIDLFKITTNSQGQTQWVGKYIWE